MAADKKILAEIETLRLDRPGRVHEAHYRGIIDALRELAATYREEAELWSRSGAKGWKGSEAEKYLVAQHIDDVAAQLDNAGGGAALSVSDDALEAELRESAKRIDALPGAGAAGLDKLIADSVAARKGHVRDEFPPADSPARSDVGQTVTEVIEIEHPDGYIERLPGRRNAGADTFPGQASADEVTAYLSGAASDIPGTPPLTPNSISSPLELDNPFASREDVADATVPKTWESETMTADGHLLPGTAKTTAPLLGQPGDASAGYSHTYVPPGGRVLTFAELLQPVHPTALPPHLSHSQISNVGDCGVQYRLQRVEQMPQVPQWANIGGTAFHAAVEAIERTICNAAAAGRPLSLDGYDVELGWKEHFEEQIGKVAAGSPVPISMWRAARKGAEGRAWWEVNGPLMLRRYLDARPDEPTMVGLTANEVPAIELEIIVDVPTPYGPVPFKAVLDRVTVRPDGTLMIRDYKTSYERPTDTTQLGEYAWALRIASGGLAPRKVFGTYFDARRGEWTEPVDLLAEHPFEAFQYRVTAAHGQKRALTVGPTPARPSIYCGGCSVRYACPVMNQLAAVAPMPS